MNNSPLSSEKSNELNSNGNSRNHKIPKFNKLPDKKSNKSKISIQKDKLNIPLNKTLTSTTSNPTIVPTNNIISSNLKENDVIIDIDSVSESNSDNDEQKKTVSKPSGLNFANGHVKSAI